MIDGEILRRALQKDLNDTAAARAPLEEQYGQVWNSDELRAEFEVLGFAAPFVLVRRRADGTEGTLMFQHHPRFYFSLELN